MGKIKNYLKTTNLYKKYKENKIYRTYFKCSYILEGQKKDSDTLIYVLSGYKDELNDVVFKRLKKFAPDNADVCIVSSGLYKNNLSKIARDNNWLYLSTKKNNVALAMNVVIKVFDKAQYIYKLDEDIFLTKNFFDELKDVYLRNDKEEMDQDIGFVAPLINVNGYGYYHLLHYYNKVKEYEKLFDRVKYRAVRETSILFNPDAAIFMWDGTHIPSIDDIDAELAKNKKEVSYCPVRFSIGAILFKRDFWEKIGYFKIYRTNGMGLDEEQVCYYSMNFAYPICVSHNTCVGHLSFGNQNKKMLEFFLANKHLFDID